MIPGGWELLLICAVLLLLFPTTMPKAARSLGQSLRILKTETRELRDDPHP